MAQHFQITCVNKNPNGMIVRLGGQQFSLSLHEAIVKAMSDDCQLHIFIGNENYELGVRGEGNEAYFVLEPAGTPLADVDGIPSC